MQELRIGLLFNRQNTSRAKLIGYLNSASAVDIAMQRVREDHLLDNFNVTFITDFDDCDESLAMEATSSLLLDYNVDAIIGPTCDRPALTAAIIAAYFNIPIYPWGMVTTSNLAGAEIYATCISLMATTETVAESIVEIYRYYQWTEYGFISTDTDKCTYLRSDIQKASDRDNETYITVQYVLYDYSVESMRDIFSRMKNRTRVITICLPDELYTARRFMLAASDEKMINDEFVFVFLVTTGNGYDDVDDEGNVRKVWVDMNSPGDGRDEEARLAFEKTFFIITSMVNADEQLDFKQEVMERMKLPPYSCGAACNELEAADLASQLHDAVYLYMLTLNRSVEEFGLDQIRNGSMVVTLSEDSFDGESGRVVIDSTGQRCPIINFVNLNQSYEAQVVLQISICELDKNVTPVIAETSKVFHAYGGKTPPPVPICGFTGNNCPLNFVKDYLWIVVVGVVIIVIAVLAVLGALLVAYKQKKDEQERLNMAWQIPLLQLLKITNKAGIESQRSLQSGPSTTSTKITMESRTETNRFAFFLYMKEPIAAEKINVRPPLLREDMSYLRKMRDLQSDNLNRFIGMCIEGPIYYTCWRYCSRGSIKDVMTKTSITMDGFFIYCLVKDIVNGLFYIHKSFMGYHGYLTSSACLVDDRWQVKISAYGVPFLREIEKRTEEEQLYTAPEILRDSMNMVGSPEGDIYSLAILFSEMVARTSAWNLENRKEDADEIIFMVKKGGRQKLRPELECHESIEVNPALLALCRDCWEEEPRDRPDIATIKNLLRNMNHGRSDNLMDHVFNMLEQYATTLEEEVEERMKELTEEKKKSDLLLYRMLPKQVADKLKLGQSVQPETFECVTLFFSDVVSFTTLASKCTPLQVVTLLNELYTIFDSVIDEHDVYKVETIGDGYLCVSGLPFRNGTEHIKEICNMSIGLLRGLLPFRVPHLPTERVNIRIGVHTGSCVAGVVGLTMPRYCLFGDTVNTASRMESNGKAGQIHLSSDANDLLSMNYPQFRTESRGEVIVKGKGVMQTFWLVFTL
ncbi:unnamed protein product [Auanema sp. JU1783]|nr:unnamed protein product [Auanema sp. JU1783]